MTLHHLFKEDDTQKVCPYCKTDISDKKWGCHHQTFINYKKMRCECGKELFLTLKFDGSGHDTWNDKKNGKKSKLEEKIKVVEKTESKEVKK